MEITKKDNKLFQLLLGPAMFLVCYGVIGTLTTAPIGVSIGTILWMAVWWITLPVDTGVTAFIPIVVNMIFQAVPMDSIITKYASETIFLLLGADLISISWEVTGLDKRVALKSLYLIGPSLKQQILVWFAASALLSVFLPNAVVCAMLIPIAVAMLRYINYEDVSGLTNKKSKTAAIILASIAWGAGIGGLGSPLGGSMNLVALEYLEELIGGEYMYFDWCIRLIPFLIILIIANYLVLLLVMPKKVALDGSKTYFKELYNQLEAISKDEKVCLTIFILVVALSFTRPLYASILPSVKPSYIFLAFGLLLFMIPRKGTKKRMLEWKSAQQKVFWGMLYMFAGGMALGELVRGTGATDMIAGLVMKLNLNGGFTTILVFVLFTVVLSEISNNTSAAAIAIPIVIGVCQEGIGISPIPYVYITIAAFNCAYMLPTTIRAIPIGYGLSPKYMMWNGLALTLSAVLVVSVLGWIMITIWPAFSIA